MLLSLVSEESNHYDLLVKYIIANNLKSAFLKINGSAENCVPFAKGYNGSQYAKFNYDVKIAKAYLKFKNKGYWLNYEQTRTYQRSS